MLVWVNMGMAANATGSGCYPCSCQSWAVESIAAGLCTVCMCVCVCSASMEDEGENDYWLVMCCIIVQW